MDENTQLIQNLKHLADGISATFGKNCEVCIHDLNDMQHSLIHISGNITGRSIGAPATDLLVKAVQQGGNNPHDLHNYRTTTNDGRILKSTTTFIRNSNNDVIAALCINFDTTDFFNATQALLPFLHEQENGSGSPKTETFASSPEETIDALFEQAVKEIGKQPCSMSTDEKVSLVELLEHLGAFQFKGAVDQIAILTGVSKFTIYNYLKKIKTKQSINHI